MAQVTIDTVIYPAWWDGASTVSVQFVDPATVTLNRSEVEMLPQGISLNSATVKAFAPWSRVQSVDKVT